MIPRTPMTDKDTALRQAHALAATRYPGEGARLDKGLLIALNGGAVLLADGSAQVRSDRDQEVFYQIRDHACDCPDFGNAPGGRCKHRLGVYLVIVALASLAMGAPTS